TRRGASAAGRPGSRRRGPSAARATSAPRGAPSAARARPRSRASPRRQRGSRSRSRRTRASGATSRARLDGLVARAADRLDQLRPPELAPELRDMDVDRPRAAGVVEPPDALEQELARDDDTPVLDQEGEEVELLRPQLDALAVDGDLARVRLEDDVAEHEHLLAGVWLGAAEHGLHPRHELPRRERLAEVVAAAGAGPRQAVGLLVAGGQHHDRHARAGADVPADLEPVHVRQVEVEDDEPHRLLLELLEGLRTGTGRDDAVALLL